MKRSSKDQMTTKFRALVSVTTSTVLGSLSFVPSSINNRIATMSDSWDLFRLDSLRFRLLPQQIGSSALNIGVAWSPGISDGPPSTQATLQSCIYSQIMFVDSAGLQTYETSERKWTKVDSGDCRGSLPFYKAVAGAPDPWAEAPGQFLVVAEGVSTSVVVKFEIEGVITFKGGIDPGSTPALRKVLRDRAEKARLLKLLATPDQNEKTAGSSNGPIVGGR
jgi:hypothetical protein